MKIMYLLFSFSIGGTERLVADICNQMVSIGNEIHLYIVNNLVSQSLISGLNEEIHICMQGRESKSGGRIATLFEINKYIKKNSIDVVHCNSFNSPELLLIAKLLNPNIRIVHTIHGIGQYKSLPKYKIVFRNIICDKFIAISKSVANDILENGCVKSKIIVVYNAIRVDEFRGISSKEFNRNKVIIGCVARIMPDVKGQDILIDSIKTIKNQYPGVKCYFAGGIAESEKENYEKLQKIVKEYELEDNIEFLGAINNVPDFLNSIDICVVPSRSEGFGLALVEAMAKGVPCVASDIDGPREIVELEQVGHLFDVGNAKDLATVLIQLIENYPQERATAINHKEDILMRYSMEKMCRELTKIYYDITE